MARRWCSTTASSHRMRRTRRPRNNEGHPMKFTDLFIRRPVLASVVSLLILVLGLRSLSDLKVSEYPRSENAVVTIMTAYYGANADTVAGFITQPMETTIAQAPGI